MSIKIDDLIGEDTTPKKEWPLTVSCEPDLRDLILSMRDRHGKRKTAEVIRRVLRAELPTVDRKLKSKSS